MVLKTVEEYIKSIKKTKPTVYTGGQRVEDVVDHPRIKPSLNAFLTTYRYASNPEYRNLLTTTSHLSGEKINRWVHIHQNTGDLMKKLQATRLLCRRVICIGRCVGWDALNTTSVVAYDIDQKYQTDYYERFLEFLKRVQKGDLGLAGVMTDAKGDRSLRPYQQQDPDVYVRVVEKREDGIVVRGAKNAVSFTPYTHYSIVMPGRAMTEKDKDYALCFAIPNDAEGLIHICRAVGNVEARDEEPHSSKYGSTESLLVFDNVFVPWENVFMCGEHEYAGEYAILFADYHRFSFCGCKSGFGDLLMGTAALAAEYNGIEEAHHVMDSLTSMKIMNETTYMYGVAAAALGTKRAVGTLVPYIVPTNLGKHWIIETILEKYRIVHDLAGGLAVTLPLASDCENPETKRYVDKYLKGKEEVPTEHRIRCMRLIRDIVSGHLGGLQANESICGAGSREAVRIMIRQFIREELEDRKKDAKIAAGIESEEINAC